MGALERGRAELNLKQVKDLRRYLCAQKVILNAAKVRIALLGRK